MQEVIRKLSASYSRVSIARSGRTHFSFLACLVCIVLFTMVDVLIFPLLSGSYEPGVAGKFVCGMFVAQAGLYTSWVVLAPFALRIRVTTAAALGLVWWVTSVLSCVLYVDPHRWAKDVALGCALVPLLAIGFQAPLWLVRGWFRWRILHVDQGPVEWAPDRWWLRWRTLYLAPRSPKKRSEGFRTRDILIGTTAVALAFGAAQMANTASLSGDLLIGTIRGSIGAAIISLVVVLPLIAATLHAQRVWLALSVTTLLQLLVFVGTFLVLCEVFEWPDRYEGLRIFGTIFSGLWVSFSAVMLVVRSLGYRLVWERIR